MFRWRLIPLYAALGLAVVPIVAQATPLVAPGARLRIHRQTDPSRPHYLTLIAGSNDSILVVRANNGIPDTLQMALRDVKKVEVLAGRKSYGLAGAAIGMVVGAAAGGIIGNALAEHQADLALQGTVRGVFIGAVIGLLGGGFAGSSIETDRWRGVPPSYLQAGANPCRDGALDLRFSWQF